MKKAPFLVTAALALSSMSLSQGPERNRMPGGGPNAPADSDRLMLHQGSWVCVAEKAAFSPRDTAEDFIFDGRMWLSNGYYHGNVLIRDLWYSVDGAAWTLVNSETPYDGYSEMVVYEKKVWAIKGSVWCSTDGVNWTQVAARTPFGIRGYGEVVVHGGKMWQLGSGDDIWCTTDGAKWKCAARHAPYGARRAAGVVVFRGKTWVMGGYIERPNSPPEKHYRQFTTYNDVWRSSDGVRWERVLTHAPWSARMWFGSKVYANRIWVIGGFDNVNGANLGDVWYTEDGVNWREFVSERAFSPRHEPTCYVFDKSLWVVAGNSWPVRNDVWRLTLPQGESEDRRAAKVKP